ncbi:hypothetical protein SAMN04487971_106146 [Paracoccus chinensis]|uniref:Uncharacterized protein n=1 Tax=Paracoccus chinensis TaxID=525640 RepID=A0A1G9HEP3_9RHOB|nr:hypothetical protein SAMN04487971_106146 [Paracoccus chinensis]
MINTRTHGIMDDAPGALLPVAPCPFGLATGRIEQSRPTTCRNPAGMV